MAWVDAIKAHRTHETFTHAPLKNGEDRHYGTEITCEGGKHYMAGEEEPGTCISGVTAS
jgi:hypothetical protein